MIALVPTCNRPELFARLVSKLEGFKVIGFVNNSTPENNQKYLNLTLPENVRLIMTNIYGKPKKCHVKTFKLMLKFATDECLVVEDDVLPCPEFYNQLVRRISTLNDYALNYTLSPILLPDRNSDFYTGGVSREIKFGGYRFIDQAWVDGNFYMTAGVLAAMKQWLSGRVKIYNASSGIGRLNSKEMAIRKWKMYTTIPTLVEHLDQRSVMFGDKRNDIPLIASFG